MGTRDDDDGEREASATGRRGFDLPGDTWPACWRCSSRLPARRCIKMQRSVVDGWRVKQTSSRCLFLALRFEGMILRALAPDLPRSARAFHSTQTLKHSINHATYLHDLTRVSSSQIQNARSSALSFGALDSQMARCTTRTTTPHQCTHPCKSNRHRARSRIFDHTYRFFNWWKRHARCCTLAPSLSKSAHDHNVPNCNQTSASTIQFQHVKLYRDS